jgi:hypothetical protein
MTITTATAAGDRKGSCVSRLTQLPNSVHDGGPAAPCAGRAYGTQLEAGRAWVRARALDPAGTVELVIYWCPEHWAWHLGRRPKPARERQP